MYKRAPDNTYSQPSTHDSDREIENVILPITVFGGAVMLVVCFLGG